MSIFEFCDAYADSGLGIALIGEEDYVVDPYVDPSDCPDMIVDDRGRWLCPHGGVLETNPNFFVIT